MVVLDVRIPGKGNSNSHGARTVHLIITMIKWFRTSRLSIKNSLSAGAAGGAFMAVVGIANAAGMFKPDKDKKKKIR